MIGSLHDEDAGIKNLGIQNKDIFYFFFFQEQKHGGGGREDLILLFGLQF